MNCGLNAGKQEKQTKKINPSFAEARPFPSEQPSFADSWALPTASAIALPTA
jgi:hypothetical protein